jgi:hypothetical protein
LVAEKKWKPVPLYIDRANSAAQHSKPFVPARENGDKPRQWAATRSVAALGNVELRE